MAPDPTRPERIGRYRILGVLGRGSMGRVFRAHDPNTDRDVALKVVAGTDELAPEAAAELRERFLVEARATGRLSHPGIVTVYDADVDPATGSPFLAMELIDGRPLSGLLRERGPLPWREAAGIGAAVAAALDHAHERGIVHRDIKPGNVLISADGAVKVTDFGIAKLLDESHTLTGSVLGTPSYMSPEQLRSEPLDGRADLFGLGALLYEMVTGEAPFRGENLATITHKVVFMDPRPPTFARPGLPEEAERIVLRALAKDREERFQTGDELAAALSATADLEERSEAPTRAEIPAVPAAPRPPGEQDRHRAPEGSLAKQAVGIVLLVLALVVVGYWLGQNGERASAPPSVGSQTIAAPAPEPGRSEADGSPGRSAPADRDRDPEARPSGPPAAPGGDAPATLQVLFNNRLRHGRMTVWIDGEKAWSTTLNVPKDPRSIVAGETVRATLPLRAGSHEIEVRVTQGSAKIDSRGTIRGSFEPGQNRWLRVVLVPYVPRLKLEWES